METKIFVFAARSWAMVDDSTGAKREGVSLHYLPTDSLVPCVNEDGSKKGYEPVKQSITLEEAKKLQAVPGFYNAKMEMRASKGQNILAVTDLTFISDFSGKK